MADIEEDTSWIVDLETTLLGGCDFGLLKNICKGRSVPDHLRAEVWQICLNVMGKGDALSTFDELFDMPEQAELRSECRALVDKLGNDEEDKVSVVSDLESILTFYCKSRNQKFLSGNGWLNILQPMLALKLNTADLYNLFYAFVTKYVPRECGKNGKPFHLFRLLLLYHEPELCSFLDTRKITPDIYALDWFQSIFASVCDLEVTLKMWDVYLQHSDPFLMFFLALVILVNSKDQILPMENEGRQAIIDKLHSFPAGLEGEDIEDFCALAQYYASRTPQSFRKDYQNPLFGTSLASQKLEKRNSCESDLSVSQALCLPVSVNELLQSASGGGDTVESVSYFIVDCRPAEQYNSGHLPTAFHLDANLMLQNPTEFATAVQALFATKLQAIAAGSVAGGEHLCFMGSGREEEDQYVHMVIANFLQKNSQFVSYARGGYSAVHEKLKEDLVNGLVDHSPKACIVCNPEMGSSSDVDTNDEFGQAKGDSLLGKFNKLSFVVKSKSSVMKDKLTNYIKNEQFAPESHVSSQDRVGKRYRNVQSVFTIGDDDEDLDLPSSDDEKRDVVKLETWLAKPEVKYSFECQQIQPNGYMCACHLLVTDSHLYVLRHIPNKKGMSLIQARRPLSAIVKITSKKRHPELITFKYGTNDDENGLKITALDRFLIEQAGEATKVIKQQIMKVLEVLES